MKAAEDATSLDARATQCVCALALAMLAIAGVEIIGAVGPPPDVCLGARSLGTCMGGGPHCVWQRSRGECTTAEPDAEFPLRASIPLNFLNGSQWAGIPIATSDDGLEVTLGAHKSPPPPAVYTLSRLAFPPVAGMLVIAVAWLFVSGVMSGQGKAASRVIMSTAALLGLLTLVMYGVASPDAVCHRKPCLASCLTAGAACAWYPADRRCGTLPHKAKPAFSVDGFSGDGVWLTTDAATWASSRMVDCFGLTAFLVMALGILAQPRPGGFMWVRL